LVTIPIMKVFSQSDANPSGFNSQTSACSFYKGQTA
jgi:hypothetical protein